MRHDIESCDQGGEDQDMTWLEVGRKPAEGTPDHFEKLL